MTLPHWLILAMLALPVLSIIAGLLLGAWLYHRGDKGEPPVRIPSVFSDEGKADEPPPVLPPKAKL